MPDLTVTTSSFVDTAIASDKTTHIVTSPFARIQVSTAAVSVDVTIYNNYSGYEYLSKVGVWVNGVYNQSIAVGANSGSTITNITLPVGTKTVDFVNGPCSGSTSSNSDANLSSCIGSWITLISFDAAFTPLTPTHARKLTIYGDSIAVGDGSQATPTGAPQQKAWPMQVRAGIDGQVSVEAWGGRTLATDAGDSTERALFVARMVIHNPTVIWLAIGTNDYGLNAWSAASFGTAYAAVLDDLHTALPNARIIAQTPLRRTTETANGSGSTLQDYRDQISTAAASRSSYVVLVDGRNLLSLAHDFDDGLHPNGNGHFKLAQYAIPLAEGRLPGISALQFRI